MGSDENPQMKRAPKVGNGWVKSSFYQRFCAVRILFINDIKPQDSIVTEHSAICSIFCLLDGELDALSSFAQRALCTSGLAVEPALRVQLLTSAP